MRTYELGQQATGVVADENDWNKTGPRIKTPRKRAWGTITGVFAVPTAVIIETASGESYCIRVDIT
jgi:hypothetical protein